MRLLLISLCGNLLLASLVSSTATAADGAASVPKLPKPMELRICANKVKHKKLIEAAQSRQARETEAKTAWTADVFESADAKQPSARWITAAASVDPKNFEYESFVTRKLPAVADKPATLQVLVVLTDDDVTSDDIAYARTGHDERDKPTVYFTLTAAGAKRFEKLTSKHLPTDGECFQIGIILSDYIQTAPRIMSVISEHGQITGNFTEDDTKAIAAVLNSKLVSPAKK